MRKTGTCFCRNETDTSTDAIGHFFTIKSLTKLLVVQLPRYLLGLLPSPFTHRPRLRLALSPRHGSLRYQSDIYNLAKSYDARVRIPWKLDVLFSPVFCVQCINSSIAEVSHQISAFHLTACCLNLVMPASNMFECPVAWKYAHIHQDIQQKYLQNVLIIITNCDCELWKFSCDYQ